MARELGWSLSLVRVECHEIWTEFVLAGVPLRDFPENGMPLWTLFASIEVADDRSKK
ncbi:hypothetical protein BH20ACT1_BH20ACT1_09740 [soil metagenome]